MDVEKRCPPSVREGKAGRKPRGRAGGRALATPATNATKAAAVSAVSFDFFAGQGFAPLLERGRLEHVG